MKKIVALLMIAVMLSAFAGCSKKLTDCQPEGEIISNNGIAIKKGDWLYVINGVMPATVDDAVKKDARSRLLRMKEVGTEISEVTQKKVANFHIYEDKVFYTTPTKTNVRLYQMNIDGTKNKKLLTLNDGDYIYYGEAGMAIASNAQIIYYDYATMERQEFATGAADQVYITDNYIYFYVQNVSGTKRVEIATGRIEKLCNDNGTIIYADDSEVIFLSTRLPYKLNANTLELTQISDTYYKTAMYIKDQRMLIAIESDETVAGLYGLSVDNVAGRPVEEGGNKQRVRIHGKAVTQYCTDGEKLYFVEDETGDVYVTDFEGASKTKLCTLQSFSGLDVVGNILIIHDSSESGIAYYVPTDGSGELKAIRWE